jgi:aminocarboxymuconate-semialdehyde decarboxylase
VLKSRSEVPYIRTFEPDPTARLIILPGEDDPSTPSTARGRPIGAEYFDIARKIEFMDQHGINISVISQANPWLDFLSASEAPGAAVEINDDINNMCGQYPGRLFAFGTLPVSAGAEACVQEVKRLKGLKWMRGVVLGTGGMGQGLDDLNMESVYTALEEAHLPVFLHPHYGLPSQVYGPRADEYGHVLPLAMG